MYWVLLMVVVIGSASFGQVDGPWTIWEGAGGHILASSCIAMIDQSRVRVIVSQDTLGHSELLTGVYDIRRHIWAMPLSLVREDSVGQHAVVCKSVSQSEWALGFLLDRGWCQEARLITASEAGRSEYFLDYACESSPPFFSDYISDFDLDERVGGGWLCTWVVNSCGGPFGECGSETKLVAVSEGNLDFRLTTPPPEYQLFGPAQAEVVSVSRDTSWLLTTIWEPGVDSQSRLLRLYPGMDSTQLDAVGSYLYCAYMPLELCRFSGDSLLIYDDDQGVLLMDTDSYCEVLEPLSFPYLPHRVVSGTQRDFAALWWNSELVKIGRYRVGDESRAAGELYRDDVYHGIRGADIALNDSGRVTVFWIEAASGPNPLPCLRFASIPWNEILGLTNEQASILPQSLAMTTFPNPFNSELRIRYDVGRAQAVSLRVFDLTGREVVTLAAGMQSAGKHDVSWNAGSFSSGVYFVRLFAEEGSAVQKVLLMK